MEIKVGGRECPNKHLHKMYFIEYIVNKKGSMDLQLLSMYIIVKSSCSTATLEWRQQTLHEHVEERLWASGKNLTENHLNACSEAIATTFLWSKIETSDS